MLEIDFIKNNQDFFLNAMRKRGYSVELNDILEKNIQKNNIIQSLEALRAEKNRLSADVGRKMKNGEDVAEIKEKVKNISTEINSLEEKLNDATLDLSKILEQLPNILLDDVPFGKDENDNIVVKTHLEPTKFSFSAKEHYNINHNFFDFERAIKLSGARFCITNGKIAKLERALSAFMLDIVSERGFNEYNVPVLINEESAFGSGQLPKFEDDLFKTTDGKYLISTSEMCLANMYANEILDEKQLPVRMTSLTHCFRSEAGSGGRDITGIIRQHQFQKVEIVSIVKPEESEKEHQFMIETSEMILQKLGLPYRVVLLCSGDIGATSAKTYDIEVWIPSQNKYREIASGSNTLTFQSKRNKTRYRDSENKKIHPHILNCSALPIGRTLVAILENFQQENGTVIIPEALRSYCGFEVL